MIVSVDSARFKIIFKQEFIVRTFKKKNFFRSATLTTVTFFLNLTYKSIHTF